MSTPRSPSRRKAMCAWASSSCTMDIAEPKLLSAGACWAARRYAGALTSSVSAETVRMRRIPCRYCGDMCWSPSTSLPERMCSRTSSSVLGARSSVTLASQRVTLDLRTTPYSLRAVGSSGATIIELDGVSPTIGEDVWLAPTAVLVGDVRVGDSANIWLGAGLRGDSAHIAIRGG